MNQESLFYINYVQSVHEGQCNQRKNSKEQNDKKINRYLTPRKNKD